MLPQWASSIHRLVGPAPLSVSGCSAHTTHLIHSHTHTHFAASILFPLHLVPPLQLVFLFLPRPKPEPLLLLKSPVLNIALKPRSLLLLHFFPPYSPFVRILLTLAGLQGGVGNLQNSAEVLTIISFIHDFTSGSYLTTKHFQEKMIPPDTVDA